MWNKTNNVCLGTWMFAPWWILLSLDLKTLATRDCCAWAVGMKVTGTKFWHTFFSRNTVWETWPLTRAHIAIRPTAPGRFVNIQGANGHSIEGDNILTCDVAPSTGKKFRTFSHYKLEVTLPRAESAITFSECWMWIAMWDLTALADKL